MTASPTAADELPPDLVRPRYGEATLADVLPGAAAALGVTVDRGLPADPLGLTGVWAEPPRGRPPHRRSGCRSAARPRSHRPSRRWPVGGRPVPVPQHHPGQPRHARHRHAAGSHGILGFVTAVPGEQTAAGEDRALNHVQWGDDPDPDTWQARRTVFEQAADAGVAVTAVGPYAYAGSGLTRAVYRGAKYTGSVSHGDLTALVLAALAAAPAPSSTATSPSSTSPATCGASTLRPGAPSCS